MSQWLRRKIISIMGNVYVWLDKGLEHETGEILGVHIDMDLQQKFDALQSPKRGIKK